MKSLQTEKQVAKKSVLYKYVIIVFIVLVLFVIFMMIFFRMFSGRVPESSTGDDLRDISVVKNEGIDIVPNFLPAKGRLIELTNAEATIQDRITEKMEKVIFSDLTTYYFWDQTNFGYQQGTQENLHLGDNLSLTYASNEKNNEEVSVVMITPPYFESGYVEQIEGNKIILVDNKGKKFNLNNCELAVVEKSDGVGQKMRATFDEIKIGDLVTVYSSYGVQYDDATFEPSYLQFISKQSDFLDLSEISNQPLEFEVENQNLVNSENLPAGINPTGVVPGVEIGS
ncbi:MAG: hypothetical protein ACOZAR_04960 [Patescibacteria group bacterium]